MPTTPSAHKELRKNLKRRQVNRGRKSAMRTWIGKTQAALQAKDLEQAERSFVQAARWIDKNAKWHQIHRNTAARRKSALASALNVLRKEKAAAPPAAGR